jgi:CubicO group peptidase (beta-lactamase class C family)
MSRLICAVTLAVLFPVSEHCLAEDSVVAKLDEFVREEMRNQHIPGLSLLVNQDGKIILAKGYGLANVEHQVQVKPETIFQSGSVGKQFTATAVMMLVEAGKIGLDDKVCKYFTNAPKTWADIKVRHLLTHTSGLGDYPSDFDFRRDYTEDQLLANVMATPLASAPGEKWSYSNLGYVTLGILIGKVSGKFYGDFLQERIFKPLGMGTARIISEEDIVTNRAASYRLVDGKLKNQEWVSPTMNSTADGSLYLTVYDLAKWDDALYTEKLIKRSSLDQMWTPVTLSNGKTHPYGFGWFIVDVRGHRLIHHGGAWQGFQCDIQRYVDDKLTVIGFDNLAQSNLEKIIRRVAGIYNPELKPLPPKEK